MALPKNGRAILRRLQKTAAALFLRCAVLRAAQTERPAGSRTEIARLGHRNVIAACNDKVIHKIDGDSAQRIPQGKGGGDILPGGNG